MGERVTCHYSLKTEESGVCRSQGGLRAAAVLWFTQQVVLLLHKLHQYLLTVDTLEKIRHDSVMIFLQLSTASKTWSKIFSHVNSLLWEGPESRTLKECACQKRFSICSPKFFFVDPLCCSLTSTCLFHVFSVPTGPWKHLKFVNLRNKNQGPENGHEQTWVVESV